MVRSVPEEYFFKYSPSEGTNIGAADSNGPEVFVATMTTFLSDSYDALEETLTHIKILKLKIYPRENVIDFCAVILVDAERLLSSGAFKTEHLGCITHIFEDTSDSVFRMCPIKNYKEVTEFIKKLCGCDMDFISQEDIITYDTSYCTS